MGYEYPSSFVKIAGGKTRCLTASSRRGEWEWRGRDRHTTSKKKKRGSDQLLGPIMVTKFPIFIFIFIFDIELIRWKKISAHVRETDKQLVFLRCTKYIACFIIGHRTRRQETLSYVQYHIAGTFLENDLRNIHRNFSRILVGACSAASRLGASNLILEQYHNFYFELGGMHYVIWWCLD